jgi:hypothetical protein
MNILYIPAPWVRMPEFIADSSTWLPNTTDRGKLCPAATRNKAQSRVPRFMTAVVRGAEVAMLEGARDHARIEPCEIETVLALPK